MSKRSIAKRSLSLLLVLATVVSLLACTVYGAQMTYTENGKEYAICHGTTDFDLQWSNGGTANTDYYYSDGYFAGNAADYNTHLATMSAALCGAVSVSARCDNIETVLTKCGYGDFVASEEYKSGASTADTIGYLIGKKTLTYADGTPTGKTAVVVVLRGANYEAEWANNVLLGASGDASGFSASAKTVTSAVQKYINDKNISNAVYWLTGHSRGAAVASMTAKSLIDNGNANSQNLFCYALATPAAAIANDTTKYASIHHIVNANDIVVALAPAAYGFVRPGVEHWVTDVVGGSDYNTQLQQVAPGASYNSAFHAAHVKIDLGDLIGGDISYDSVVSQDGTMSLAQYISDFTGNVFGSWKSSRSDDYANRTFTNDVTLESAVSTYLGLFFGMSSTQESQFSAWGKAFTSDLVDDLGTTFLVSFAKHVKDWNKVTTYSIFGKTYTNIAVSDDTKKSDINKLWNAAESYSANGYTLQSILGDTDFAKAKAAFPVLVEFCISLISHDYNEDYVSGTSHSGSVYLFCTLLNNIQNDNLSIIAPHCLGCYLPALRAEDSFYTTDAASMTPVFSDFTVMGVSTAATPTTGESKLTYTASGFTDQFGDAVSEQTVTWSMIDSANTGATIDSATGTVTLKPTTKAGTVTIQATAGTVTEKTTLKITRTPYAQLTSGSGSYVLTGYLPGAAWALLAGYDGSGRYLDNTLLKISSDTLDAGGFTLNALADSEQVSCYLLDSDYCPLLDAITVNH